MAGLLLTLAGCGSSGNAATGRDNARNARLTGFTIAFCQSDAKRPWQRQMKKDMQMAAGLHADVSLLFANANGSASKQQSQVEKFTADGASVIILNPVDAQALTEPAAKAFAAGIPVIVVQRPLIGDRYTCSIRTDELQLGSAAGRWLAETLQAKGSVVELKSLETSEPPQDRHSGFQTVMRENPGFRVLRELPVPLTRQGGYKRMKELLAELSRIDAVYAHNDAAAYGAYLAAKEAGREGEILFVGIGGLPDEGQAYVSNGALSASIQYPTGGIEAIEAAVKLRHQGQLPRKIRPTVRIFAADNVAQGGELVE
jgi:ribose transport system substrate-binding protein